MLMRAYHSLAKDTSGCSKSCRPGGQRERVNERGMPMRGTDPFTSRVPLVSRGRALRQVQG